MSWPSFVLAVLVSVTLPACAPVLDWREVRAEGTGIVASFPCKPDRHARDVALAGARLRMDLLVCEAGGVTFGLGYFDLTSPAAVTPAVQWLRDVAQANIGAGAFREQAVGVPGMTPNPRSARLVLTGRRPDGVPIQEELAVFVRGLRVYQATVLGERLPSGAVDTFFAGLRFES